MIRLETTGETLSCFGNIYVATECNVINMGFPVCV